MSSQTQTVAVRVIDRERRDDRALDDVERLVVAADENVDRGPISGRRQSCLFAIGIARAVL